MKEEREKEKNERKKENIAHVPTYVFQLLINIIPINTFRTP